MRELVILEIIALWAKGYDEINSTGGLVRLVSHGYENGVDFYLVDGKRYPMNRETNIRPLLDKLYDAELLVALDCQHCQKYR